MEEPKTPKELIERRIIAIQEGLDVDKIRLRESVTELTDILYKDEFDALRFRALTEDISAKERDIYKKESIVGYLGMLLKHKVFETSGHTFEINGTNKP